MKNRLGDFFSSKHTILLESNSSVDFTSTVMKYLTRDLDVDLILLYLNDFEDIIVHIQYEADT